MSKAVLVMDMPERCAWCRLFVRKEDKNYCAGMTGIDRMSPPGYFVKPDNCPLKPLPDPKRKKAVLDSLQYADEQMRDGAYVDGWNDCLKEIGGDDE